MKFIAEIGKNYNGNFPLCYELIKEAKYSGAGEFLLLTRIGRDINKKILLNI